MGITKYSNPKKIIEIGRCNSKYLELINFEGLPNDITSSIKLSCTNENGNCGGWQSSIQLYREFNNIDHQSDIIAGIWVRSSHPHSFDAMISCQYATCNGGEGGAYQAYEIWTDAGMAANATGITPTNSNWNYYTFSATDIDSDQLIFSAVGSEHVTTNLNNNMLTLIPQDNWNGTESINVSVSDGEHADNAQFI